MSIDRNQYNLGVAWAQKRHAEEVKRINCAKAASDSIVFHAGSRLGNLDAAPGFGTKREKFSFWSGVRERAKELGHGPAFTRGVENRTNEDKLWHVLFAVDDDQIVIGCCTQRDAEEENPRMFGHEQMRVEAEIEDEFGALFDALVYAKNERQAARIIAKDYGIEPWAIRNIGEPRVDEAAAKKRRLEAMKPKPARVPEYLP